MAKSVTLWGATYSNVPAIEVPSGNSTAKFIEPSPTTATVSDVASGKIFFDSSGTQRTGTASGGSVPYPTFNVTWSNDWSDILSVTCDKTYQYCRDLYLNDADSRAVTIEHDQANTETYYLGATSYMVSGNTDVKYVVISGGGPPELDISYHQNGTITFNYPSSQIIDVTPTATKGTVSNNAINVTPSVAVPSGGFVSRGTRTGTPVTVTASELVSGNTLYCDDAGSWNVTNAETFVVAQGTAGTPTATKGSVSNHSINVTPSVTNTEGWISGGTKTGTAVSVSASELVSGNLAITQNGNNIDVTNYQTVSVNVSGGSSKNAQAHQSTTRATSSSYTSVNSFTCTKAGTYTVYWSCMRSSTSGTSGSQLYINGNAYGTADTTTWSNHVQNKMVTGVTIGANQSVAVYARSRGNNYYSYVPLITIIEE
jgi:hypothetical protein